MIMKTRPVDRNASVEADLSLFQALVEDFHPRDFDIRFWDGSTWHAEGPSPAKFTLILNHQEALQNMFSPPPKEISILREISNRPSGWQITL
jgi:hypothetical protein